MDEMMTLKVGTLLHNGAYRIERVLGQGGFGITYLAVHVRLKKRVAIKEFFPKSFCDRDADTSQVRTASKANSVTVEKLRNKFVKEAEHIAEMDSPYIVRIIDVFEENHTAYYIMDYIEGRSLSEIVRKEGPLPVGQAVDYITRIGDALTYIHSKRMNHLDVKPANIMVRLKDNTPILIDFGLSKQYDSEGNQTSTTPVGISHGYAPMEQYNDGGVKEFSPQTDLYSLAATLYFLLSGVVPPQAPRLLDEELTFPAQIPQWLQPIIRQAMSSKRTHRQQSIKYFCEQLNGSESTDEVTQYDSKKDTNTKQPQKSDHGSYETDNSYAYRKKTESSSKKDRRENINKILKIASLCFLISIVVGICLWGPKACKSNDDNPISVGSNNPDTLAVVEAAPVDAQEEFGAPLSVGEVEDGRGGYDDNAEGYFNMHADEFLTPNRDVYFDGYFSDDKGKYPISLKFEIDDNWFPGTCYYYNIDYNTKLKMSVRFTEEQMIITGDVAGSKFVINLEPTTDGNWAGSAQNGNHKLRASITPVKMP